MELVVVARNDDICQVQLVGSLNVAGMHEIDERFHQETAMQGKPCIVDMSQVDFVASLGMGMLISCAQSLHRKGHKMVLLNPQAEVRDVMDVVGITESIPVAENEEEACAMLLAD